MRFLKRLQDQSSQVSGFMAVVVDANEFMKAPPPSLRITVHPSHLEDLLAPEFLPSAFADQPVSPTRQAGSLQLDRYADTLEKAVADLLEPNSPPNKTNFVRLDSVTGQSTPPAVSPKHSAGGEREPGNEPSDVLSERSSSVILPEGSAPLQKKSAMLSNTWVAEHASPEFLNPTQSAAAMPAASSQPAPSYRIPSTSGNLSVDAFSPLPRSETTQIALIGFEDTDARPLSGALSSSNSTVFLGKHNCAADTRSGNHSAEDYEAGVQSHWKHRFGTSLRLLSVLSGDLGGSISAIQVLF